MEAEIYQHAMTLFFAALLASLFLTPRTASLAKRCGAVDSPDGFRKVHSRAVTRLGGIAIALSMLGVLLSAPGRSAGAMPAFLSGAVVIVLVGFFDDLSPVPTWAKFLGQVAGASTFVSVSGIRLEGLGDLFGTGPIDVGPIAPYLTVFCMVGVMNALNLSDGLDGLAGGIGTIVCSFFAIFAFRRNDPAVLYISVALLGALFGFLRYNTFPAKLFMGDSGSLLLGYTLSAMAVSLVQPRGGDSLAPVTVAGVLALPVIDTLLVMARRLWHRQSPFLPDKTHLHHRLIDLGLPHAAVVPILYLAVASFGLLSWAMRGEPEWARLAAIVALGVAVYGSVFLFQHFHGPVVVRVPGPGADPRWGDGRFAVRLSGWMGKTVPFVTWFIALGLILPAAVSPGVSPVAGVVALGMAGFLVVLFPWRSQRVDSGICFGLIYASCVCMLGILHFLPAASSWVGKYLNGFSAVVLVWVFLKMKVQSGHKKVMLVSGFEALLIGGSLFVPVVLVPAAGYGNSIRDPLLMACLESIPLLFALKILVRKQLRRNTVIVGGLLAGLVVLGLKGAF